MGVRWRWLSVNYVLSEPEGQLTACIYVKNGDSLLLGTLESPKPGYVRLVFLHTSSAS